IKMAGETDVYEVPTYAKCIEDIYVSISKYVRESEAGTFGPTGFYNQLEEYGYFPMRDFAVVGGLAVLWTIIRYILTENVFLPLGKYTQMSMLNQKKFPESAFKLIFYVCTWTLSTYMLFIKEDKYTFFERPLDLWKDWSPGMFVPWDMYALYMVQCSFYLHSVYGTLYMDQWRKDSIVMMFHHFLTLSLIGFSYAARFHKIGVLVLFVHDITDICLEFTKCNVYLKTRGGKIHKLNDHLTTIGFLFFAGTWYVFRLYWFPLKILLSAALADKSINASVGPLPFYIFFNSLLWILQVLNVYWFLFIVRFLYKIARGQMSEVDDVREIDVEDEVAKKKPRESRIKFIVNFLYKVATGQVKEVDDMREYEVEKKLLDTKSGKPEKNGVAESNGVGSHGDIPNGNGTPRRSARQRKTD
ncbi:unnamed protein product, partial [Owenia fusiformis]